MHRKLIGSALVCALILSGCGDSAPAGAKATKMVAKTRNAVTWRNLCKKVTLSFTDDSGAPSRYGGTDAIALTITGAAAYDNNHCTGNPIATVFAGPENTDATFYVKATDALPSTSPYSYSVSIAASGSGLSATATLTAQPPTANLVLGQPNFDTGTSGVSSTTLTSPFGVERCGNRVVVADQGNNRVLVWNEVPTQNGVGASLVLGQANFAASAAVASQTGMSAPTHAICANGRLYVADYANSRLLGYNTFPANNGAAADFVWGQSGFNAGGATATTNLTDEPTSLSIFGSKLVATNSTWSRMIVWNNAPVTGTDAPDYVIGQPNFTTKGNTPPPSAASLNESYSGKFRENYLLVADAKNNRALVYDATALATGMSAMRVLGQAGFTTATQGNGASGLYFPTSVEWDGDHLLVADNGNNRILVWNGFPSFDGAPADLVIGHGAFATGSGLPTALTGGYSQLTLDGEQMWVSDVTNNRVLRFGAP